MNKSILTAVALVALFGATEVLAQSVVVSQPSQAATTITKAPQPGPGAWKAGDPDDANRVRMGDRDDHRFFDHDDFHHRDHDWDDHRGGFGPGPAGTPTPTPIGVPTGPVVVVPAPGPVMAVPNPTVTTY